MIDNPLLSSRVLDLLREIRASPVENLIVFSPNEGKVLARRQGTPRAVNYAGLTNLIDGNVVIHNHPIDVTFSNGDFRLWNYSPIASIVVSPKRIFLTTSPENFRYPGDTRMYLTFEELLWELGGNQSPIALMEAHENHPEIFSKAARRTAEALGLEYQEFPWYGGDLDLTGGTA